MARVFVSFVALLLISSLCAARAAPESDRMRMPNWPFIKPSSVRTLVAFTTPETEKDPDLTAVWHKLMFSSTAPIGLYKVDCANTHLTKACFEGLFLNPRQFPHIILYEGGYFLPYTGKVVFEELEEWARYTVIPEDDAHKIKIPKIDKSKIVKDKHDHL